jgi:hypothetical protein
MERPAVLPTQLDLKQTTATVCDSCKGEAFQEAIMLRRVSALLTGTGRGGFIPVQVFCCVKCGHVNDNFIPAELRTSILP